MISRSLARFSVLLLFSLIFVASSFAANSWIGTVTDSSGKPVANATVLLHAISGGHDYESRTSAAGEFHFESVEPGSYLVSAILGGKTWSLSAPFSITDGS